MSRAILVCSSEFAPSQFSHTYDPAQDTVIAVDRGFTHLANLGIAPHIALGDFDSLGYVPVLEEGEVLTFPAEKDQSDLEIALELASQRGFHEMLVFGALGGRLDQTMAALRVAVAYKEHFQKLVLIGPREKVYVLSSGDTLHLNPQEATVALEQDAGAGELEPRQAKYVSIFAAFGMAHGVHIEGLKYEYEGDLEAATSLGMSNEFTDQCACISLKEGNLFVVIQTE